MYYNCDNYIKAIFIFRCDFLHGHVLLPVDRSLMIVKFAGRQALSLTALNNSTTLVTFKVLRCVKKTGSDRPTNTKRVEMLSMVHQKDHTHTYQSGQQLLVHLVKLILNCSSSSFVIRVNLLHP